MRPWLVRTNDWLTLVGAGASEAASSTLGLAQRLDFLELWIEDLLADQLCNAVAFGDGELDIRMIEEDDTQIAAIILVHHSRSNIYEVLGGESGSGSDASIAAFGKFDLDVGLDDHLASSRDHAVVGAVNGFLKGFLAVKLGKKTNQTFLTFSSRIQRPSRSLSSAEKRGPRAWRSEESAERHLAS